MLHWDKDPAVQCQAYLGEALKVVNHSVQESQVFGTGHQAASLHGTLDYSFVPWGGTFGDGICRTGGPTSGRPLGLPYICLPFRHHRFIFARKPR